MSKFSPLGLILVFAIASLQINAQTTGSTSQQQTGSTISTTPASTTSGSQPATIPGVGTVSEDQLRALGLDDASIDAVMGAMGTPAGGVPQLSPAVMQEVQQSATQGNAPANAQSTPQSPAANQAIQQNNTAATTANGNSPAPVWGQDFFRSGDITLFDKVPNGKVDENYVLGSGDQISVSAYGGVSSFNGTYTVNDDGYITEPGLGRIYLKGLTFGAARQLLRQRFGTYINVDSKFDVSLVYSKTIKVNIVGEVMHPGSYNISSINTAFNAMVAAGGPTDIGSVRSIQIKRDGKVIKTLDVYQFLMNPGSTDDTYLLNNDYIIVNPIGKVVTLTGEINRPNKYELVKGENLNEAIYYGGGLKSTAYRRTITIKRYANNENVAIDINLDELQRQNVNYPLVDGDNVNFAKIPEVIENVVQITGSVRFPGTYELTDGLRISDVIEKAKGLTYDAYTNRAYLIRKNDKLNDVYIPFNLEEVMNNPNSPFNFKLTKYDVIDIFTKDKFKETFNVSITGAVKAPGQFPYYDKMTLKDLLYYTGGLKVEAANNKIEISRIVNFNEAKNQNQPTRVVILTVLIDKDLEIVDSAETFQLQPYDQVYVRTTPEFELQKNVTINGEVKYPGTYTLLSKTETIADLIQRAGGVTQYAYVEGATISRSNVTNTLLFLKKALDDPESRYNYVLREGDVIVVPKQGDLVAMKGAIQYPFVGEAGTVMAPFEKGKSARYYVKHYGKNFADNADRRKTYVVQPNNYVKRTHTVLWVVHFYPHVKVKGSEVVVPVKPVEPPKPQAPPAPKPPFDWNVFMGALLSGILAFATVYVLLLRVP